MADSESAARTRRVGLVALLTVPAVALGVLAGLYLPTWVLPTLITLAVVVGVTVLVRRTRRGRGT